MPDLTAMIPRRFTLVALGCELGLGGLGLVLGWWFDTWPAAITTVGAGPLLGRQIGVGLLAALPLCLGLIAMDRYPVGMLRQLQRTVQFEVVPLFRGTSVTGLLAISVAAGLGEEVLFRGFLQSAIAAAWGPAGGVWIGWAAASLVFGVCHSLCAAYAVVATAIGLLLGALYVATGSLVAPVTTHAAYDFLALLYLLRGTTDAPRGA
jgi:membrane protease YdiL (CAAX protease family)